MTITCDCGFEARAGDEAGLVAEVKRHASKAHGMRLSDDEARALAFRSELGSPVTADREPPKEEP
jgi:predicted small metal-binding protein